MYIYLLGAHSLGPKTIQGPQKTLTLRVLSDVPCAWGLRLESRVNPLHRPWCSPELLRSHSSCSIAPSLACSLRGQPLSKTQSCLRWFAGCDAPDLDGPDRGGLGARRSGLRPFTTLDPRARPLTLGVGLKKRTVSFVPGLSKVCLGSGIFSFLSDPPHTPPPTDHLDHSHTLIRPTPTLVFCRERSVVGHVLFFLF